jgi:hypothetical protein
MMARRNEMTLYNYGQNGNTVAVQHTEVQPPFFRGSLRVALLQI